MHILNIKILHTILIKKLFLYKYSKSIKVDEICKQAA